MQKDVWLLIGAGALALIGCGGAGGGGKAADPGPIGRAFSHNDFNRMHPLDDALAVGIRSLEADVLLYNGDILLGENILTTVGKFEPMYLEKLEKRVKATGSVYGDGSPFYLWIDIKSDDTPLRQALEAMFARYASMLTSYGPDGAHPGPVDIVLTGSDPSKKMIVAEESPRLTVRDSNDYSTGDPARDALWTYYALSFKTYVGDWDGMSPFPEDQKQKLADLVRGAHAKGRPLRLWDAPDTIASWQAQLDAGVDLVGADDIQGLAALISAKK